MAEIGLFEAIYSQRALRRLRPDPVPDELVWKLLDAAIRAPSASNQQAWRFVVVRDPELKHRLADYYRDVWYNVYNSEPPADENAARLQNAARHLVDHMHEAPVLILACIDHEGSHSPGYAMYASIYPAVQNLLLAARGLGLGAVVTTLHKRHEDDVKRLLGIPATVETCALIPVGYPVGRYGPTRRRPVAEVTHWDRWGIGKAREGTSDD